MPRQMILATFIHNSGAHPGGWRYPKNGPVDQHDFRHYARLAQTVQRGKLHVYFSGDSQGYVNIEGKDAFAAADWAGRLEPTTFLAALAAVTSHIGLVATVSTTFNEHYSIARRFASIDQISGGRAGWNVVTSTGAIEARNFGLSDIMLDLGCGDGSDDPAIASLLKVSGKLWGNRGHSSWWLPTIKQSAALLVRKAQTDLRLDAEARPTAAFE